MRTSEIRSNYRRPDRGNNSMSTTTVQESIRMGCWSMWLRLPHARVRAMQCQQRLPWRTDIRRWLQLFLSDATTLVSSDGELQRTHVPRRIFLQSNDLHVRAEWFYRHYTRRHNTCRHDRIKLFVLHPKTTVIHKPDEPPLPKINWKSDCFKNNFKKNLNHARFKLKSVRKVVLQATYFVILSVNDKIFHQ